MKTFYSIFLFVFPIFLYGQNANTVEMKNLVFTPEILLGKTMEANEGFPKTRLQYQVSLGMGRYHTNNPQEWASRLKSPKTGFNFTITNFGNLDSLGMALSLMPIIEFNIFRSEKLKLQTGLGATYFTKKYHPELNPNNKAVTTDITWAYKMNFYYEILKTKNLDWRIGLSYSHHSNGHTRLLNQGYNSFSLSLSADIKDPIVEDWAIEKEKLPVFHQSIYSYLELRTGFGQNVLGTAFNHKNDVYTIAGEYGYVFNKTFKLGLGFYYRFYQHYYDYINNNESLVQPGREFDSYSSDPWGYASNVGISLHGEVLLNHVGIDLQIGYNFFKPAYDIDWRINEGWENTPREIPKGWVLGEFTSYFYLKKKISTRLGIKYYLFGTDKPPTNNFYIGAHLNSNLSQADFTELSLGYVYSFDLR